MVGTKGMAEKTASEYAGQLTALVKRRESENRNRLMKGEGEEKEPIPSKTSNSSDSIMSPYDPEETDLAVCQKLEEEFPFFKCTCIGDLLTKFEFECKKMTTSLTGDFEDGALTSLTVCSDACPKNLGLSDYATGSMGCERLCVEQFFGFGEKYETVTSCNSTLDGVLCQACLVTSCYSPAQHKVIPAFDMDCNNAPTPMGSYDLQLCYDQLTHNVYAGQAPFTVTLGAIALFVAFVAYITLRVALCRRRCGRRNQFVDDRDGVMMTDVQLKAVPVSCVE